MHATTLHNGFANAWQAGLNRRVSSSLAGLIGANAARFTLILERVEQGYDGVVVDRRLGPCVGAVREHADWRGIAARNALLARVRWNVEALGLRGAYRVRVLVGADVHADVNAPPEDVCMEGDGVSRIARPTLNPTNAATR